MRQFTRKEITDEIDKAWEAVPFDKISFGHTKRGVCVLYTGSGYKGLVGGFAACRKPEAMEVMLREHAASHYALSTPRS